MGENCIFVPAVGTEVAQQSMGTGIGSEYHRGNVNDAMERNEWRRSSDAASAGEGMISRQSGSLEFIGWGDIVNDTASIYCALGTKM